MERKNALQGCNGGANLNVAGNHNNSTSVSGNCNIVGNNSTNTINIQIPVAVLYEMLAQLKALNIKMERQLDVIEKMQKQLRID